MPIDDRAGPAESEPESETTEPDAVAAAPPARRRSRASRLAWAALGVVAVVGVGGLVIDGRRDTSDDVVAREQAGNASVDPVPNVTAAPAAVATTAAPTVPPATLPGGDVNRAAFIVDDGVIPASSEQEPSGNFRLECMFSHLAYDDPIVYPGQPGASHLHMFFGNTEADAFSTYESLRATGDSTCSGGPLNRTGYWAPAVLDGDGKVVVPEYQVLYYKANIGGQQAGQREQIESTATMPPGLRMIAGYNMDDPAADSRFHWYCSETTDNTSPTIHECPANELVGVSLTFPTCWDGVNLDSADHRSHMAYRVASENDTRSCPTSHPVPVPEFTLGVWFAQQGDTNEWSLSSDSMGGMQHDPGSTFHSDWFGAWDPETEQTWVNECVREMRDCVFGELGDGTRLLDPVPYTGPRRIDPPPPPSG